MDIIGKLISINNNNYRILCLYNNNYYLCQTQITNLIVLPFPELELLRLIRSSEATILDEDFIVVDETSLSAKQIEFLGTIRSLMDDISSIYGPTYEMLVGKNSKPQVADLLEKYKISRTSFWKYIRIYLQSGMQPYALLRPSHYKKQHTTYNYKTKTGAKGISQIVVTDLVSNQFEEFLNEYKKGRETSFKNSYIGLINKYYSFSLPGQNSLIWLPESERPTYNQFYYYCKKHLSIQEQKILKTSRSEFRNSNRLLLGSSRKDAIRPGWILEADALEADFSLVSELNPEQTIGRPIVYMLIDVYSSAIVAFSVGFENNSLLGITNLLMNLADNKKEYVSKYDIEFNDYAWPSNFIPHEIRCDRGSDFKSDAFGKICNRLGITRTLVSGGTGSLKGIVEQSFHQFQSSLRVEMENKGLITKRYDSNHHREAMLNVSAFTKLLLQFVLNHNRKFIENYPITKDMYKYPDFKPTPAIIWQYGCQKFGSPRVIVNHKQYLYELLPEATATISRDFIKFKNLFYINSDPNLIKTIFSLGAKRKKFTIRYDPRDVSNIYYLDNGQLRTATLNSGKVGNIDFMGMSWREYHEYLEIRKALKKEGQQHNLMKDALLNISYKKIIATSSTKHLSNSKNIRENRKVERHKVNYEQRVSRKLQSSQIDMPKSQISNDTIPIESCQVISSYDPFSVSLSDLLDDFE